MVSGMLASWLSAGIPIDKVIDWMYAQAHPRVEGGVKALYNGIPITNWPEEDWPPWYKEDSDDKTPSVVEV